MSTPPGSYATLDTLVTTDQGADTGADASPGFLFGTLPARVTFGTQGIPPPSPLYVAQGERLRIIIVTQVGVGFVNAAARLLKVDGTIQIYNLPVGNIPGSGSTSSTTFEFDLSEGFLLDVAVFPVGPITRGDVFCIIGLIRGTGTASLWVQTLVQDYFVGKQAVGWPGGRIISSVEGRGALTVFTVPNPVAGASALNFTTPAGVLWRPIAVNCIYTASAAPGTRQLQFLINLNSALNYNVSFAATQAPNTFAHYVAAVGVQRSSGPSSIADNQVPIPTGLLLDNRSASLMQFLVSGNDVADQFSAGQLATEQWVQP